MKEKYYYFKNIFLPFLLLTIIFIAFWNIQHHDFIDDFDDNVYVTDNPHITSGLKLENIKWALTAKVSANWHPVTLVSHMIDCQLFGLNSGKHHLVNLLFHILNTLILFIVLKQMTGRHWESFVVAAFFGLHPIHVESVAWISERKDVLSTFFALLTIWSYARYSKQPSIKKYLPVFFFFLLGIMSKPMVVTLPFALLLLDYWPLNRFDIHSKTLKPFAETKNRVSFIYLVLEKTPLFLLSAVSSIITFRFQKFIEGTQTPDIYPLFLRISNALVSYIKYIYKLIFPVNLSILYPFPEYIPPWQIILAVVCLLTITVLVIRFGLRYKFLPVGWFWYLGTLVPVIGIVRVGAQAMADRYMYIPSIGLFIIIAWIIPFLLSKWRLKVPFIATLSCVTAMLLTITTWHQVKHWSNSITLFEHAIAVDENNTFAHNHLGVTMARYGLRDETVRYTSEGLKKNQNRPVGRKFKDDPLNQTYVKTYTALGKDLLKNDNIDAAIIHLKEALLADPHYVDAKEELEKALTIQKKEIEEAEKIQDSLKKDSKNVELYLKLGQFYMRRWKPEMAEAQYQKALSINPHNMDALMKIAELNAIRGRYEKSVAFYKQVVALEQENFEAYYQLASIYARRRKIEESVYWLEKAVEKGFNDWDRIKKDKSLKTINGTRYYKELIKN